MQAIKVSEYGDSDVLEVVERDRPDPGTDEVRIDVEAVGVNFADIVQRSGRYPESPDPPFVPGLEAAGTIDATGEAVGLDEGDPVMVMLRSGGYAEYVVADVEAVLPIPGGLDFKEAAGFPIQYLTAHNCLFEWGNLDADESVLVHAAAGGVGTAAVQLASQSGAEVFGTASTDEKLDLAEDLGCDHPINYEETDFVDEVLAATDGEGVDIALDGVGGNVLGDTLEATKHFGRVVTFGAASGTPAKVDTMELFTANQSLVGFHLANSLQQDPSRALSSMTDLQQRLMTGELEVVVGETFDLSDASDAHRFVENRSSMGKVVLCP
ncbi:quinone oxidoreductase family protein [Halorussus ruber]|uniref:quinone oxidoreductase family protein n=1 Tax=Halorussus ruber TaxID=1126238 RepID=UPI001092EC3D|nr:NADPH:quinone oxidoreductase family protein [Halorussus ruber]